MATIETMPDNLILVEHEAGRVKAPSLCAVSAAERLGGGYALLLVGHSLGGLVETLDCYGAVTVFLADDQSLEYPLADRYAAVVAHVARRASSTCVLGASSTFTKDVLPRAAALLDWPMLSDVTHVETVDGVRRFQRPVSAGTAVATVELDSPCRVLTVRASAFAAPQPAARPSAMEHVAVDSLELPDGMRFVSQQQRASDRPDLTEARRVVAGGRPLRSKEVFDELIGGLAAALGAAVGATRAAVDAGIAPNDWQIGQTGKMIAPDLYVAIGISGAVQHAAGIKDSRVIVAINKDAEAPIFDVATYGLVGDLYQVVPELTAAIRRL